VRLNGTSDVDWIGLGVFEAFPEIVFYDYTKRPDVALRALSVPNYFVTFSRSESNHRVVKRMMDNGVNVAVVFDDKPDTWRGLEVVDGDEHDFRFMDKPRVVIGLKAKGKARHDESGFVVRLEQRKEKVA
jgi:hypothetical protein